VAEQLELFPADDNAILCRGEVYVTSKSFEPDGYDEACSAHDVMEGQVCFTGDVKWAAWAMNQSILSGDEEWVENAVVGDVNTVLLSYVDGPNDYREDVSVARCAK